MAAIFDELGLDFEAPRLRRDMTEDDAATAELARELRRAAESREHTLLQLELDWRTERRRSSEPRQVPGVHRAVEAASGRAPSQRSVIATSSAICTAHRRRTVRSPNGHRRAARTRTTELRYRADQHGARAPVISRRARGGSRRHPRVPGLGEAAHTRRTAVPPTTTRRHTWSGAPCRSGQGLRQLQHDHLQSRNVGEVLGVRGEQPEVTLDGLCRKPEVVDPNVRISSGLSEFCSQAAEHVGGFDSDPQLGFSTKSTKHRKGPLLLRTRSQQL
jgi:hypothetical protein